MLRPILCVAQATFHEAWRRRFLNGMLVFAVLLIASSRALMRMQPGAELNMLIDIGLGSIRTFGMLIAVFLGARLIADEMEKRTIYTILTKPVTRAQFLLGKFLGGVATVWSNIAVMGLVFYALFAATAPKVAAAAAAREQDVSLDFMYANVAKAIGLCFFELLIVMALAVALSTIFSWIVSSILTLTLFVVGQQTGFISTLGNAEHGASKLAQIVMGTVYRVLPHFDVFDIREAILQGRPVEWDHLGKVVAYAVFYVVVVLLLGYLFFNEREV
jgi:ABC-type transport system involved in multi-copper enzyme maturation permease subunit